MGFEFVECTGVPNHVLNQFHLGIGQRHRTNEIQDLLLRRVCTRHRDRHQGRRLAFAKIVADRFAGHLGFTERTEDIIAHLERIPEW